MSVDELYLLVSEAIHRAEAYEELGAPGASAAYADVSRLEEEIAKRLPASDPEGSIARRGAVRAAVAAKDYGRASQLIWQYSRDSAIEPKLKSELQALLGARTGQDQAEQADEKSTETVWVVRMLHQHGKPCAYVTNLRTNTQQIVKQPEELGPLLMSDDVARTN